MSDITEKDLRNAYNRAIQSVIYPLDKHVVKAMEAAIKALDEVVNRSDVAEAHKTITRAEEQIKAAKRVIEIVGERAEDGN